MNLCARAFIT
ncbi:hypothetical protein D030_0076A, partial [Vibrio parahaemolyticus AQ3810]